MRLATYEVIIELSTLTPLIVEATSKAAALEEAGRLLLADLSETPEAVGDPVTEPPRIRSAKKLGG